MVITIVLPQFLTSQKQLRRMSFAFHERGLEANYSVLFLD